MNGEYHKALRLVVGEYTATTSDYLLLFRVSPARVQTLQIHPATKNPALSYCLLLSPALYNPPKFTSQPHPIFSEYSNLITRPKCANRIDYVGSIPELARLANNADMYEQGLRGVVTLCLRLRYDSVRHQWASSTPPASASDARGHGPAADAAAVANTAAAAATAAGTAAGRPHVVLHGPSADDDVVPPLEVRCKF